MVFSRTAPGLAAALLVAAGPLFGQAPPPPAATSPRVVSATKSPEDPLDVPAQVSVISGDDLRRRGAKTVAEALQDVAGLDTGNGSDDGSRLANFGLRGLRDLDAFLVTVDGVPAGGPFRPSLAFIPVENVDRIEIVRGPQGTLYGVSAFAGMIQVFTRHPVAAGGALTLGAGSFSDKHGSLSYVAANGDQTIHLFGTMARNKGWQDRTDSSSDRLSVGFTQRTKEGSVDVTLGVVRDTSYFGSPELAFSSPQMYGLDFGRIFERDRNYEVGGARLDHRIYSLATTVSQPLSSNVRLENTLGLSRDEQIAVRTFVNSIAASGTNFGEVFADGAALTPLETTLFDDAHLVADLTAGGRHRLVTGVAYTSGRTTFDGTGVLLSFFGGTEPVPSLEEATVLDQRSAEESRTFWSLYANDAWTPFRALTLTFGARYDHISQSFDTTSVSVGAPEPDLASDSRTDAKWSYGVAALIRIVDRPKAAVLDALNLYVSGSSNFRPASPNIFGPRDTETLDSPRLLDPQRIRSGEVGLKTRWARGRLSFDVTLFHMSVDNIAVHALGSDRLFHLVNAGEQIFQGLDAELVWALPRLEGFSLSAGYGHHDARYGTFSDIVSFSQDPIVLDGNRLELVPRDQWNARVSYAPKAGLGFWAAIRHQSIRPLDRKNTFYAEAFTEWDAGASWEFRWGRVSLAGRNLGDNRHFASGSELGAGQFYVAPPRRFVGEIAFTF